MILFRPLARLATCTALAVLGGCGSDETQATEDHTPVTFTVLMDGAPAPTPLALTSGETVRVRLAFENAAGENLDDVETTHFGRLTFDPASLATVVPVSDHHYQFDVTAGPAATGTLQVGYGHDSAADEVTFPAVTVIVDAP